MNSYNANIAEMPKVDLHRHLDGDVHTEILYEMMQEADKEFDYSSPEEIQEDFDEWREEGFGTLLQNGFGLVTGLMQTEESLKKVAKEEVRNLAENNIIYGEIRFGPQYHTGESEFYGHEDSEDGLNYDEVISAVAEGLEEGEDEYEAKTNLIVCIGRESEPEKGVEIAEAAIDNSDKVAALDLAGMEKGNPPEKHLEAFKKTFDTDLYRTVHSGEFAESEEQLRENMETAIYDLEADRIGHARTISHYDDLIEAVKDREVGLEMNPLSNIFCGYIEDTGELGIPDLLEEDLPVSVNSDDPAMFGFSQTENIEQTMKENSLDMDDYMELQRNAVETAFMSEGEKEDVLEKLESFEEV